MSVFDWCMRDQHGDCKGSFDKWYQGPVGKGRQKKTGVIYTGETETCDCKCHREAE